MLGGGDALPLRDRGLIGDTATAALVGADGTIDWYCPRRFDEPASLFRLLDPEGGAVRVGPAGEARPGEQSYEPQTNVLRTVLRAGEGEVEVVDFLPHDGVGLPPGRIVRLVTARRGPVELEIDVQPGHRFGPATRVSEFSTGIAFDSTVVRAGVPFSSRRASVVLDAGEQLVVSIDDRDDPHHEPLTIGAANDLRARTADHWRRSLDGATIDGPYQDAVARSLLALGALSYHRNGAVIAAPTTSLPEHVGGERNWDYRYAWIRDSTLAVDALYDAGLRDPSNAFCAWMLDVMDELEWPLRPLYDVDGGPVPPEEELPLAGWRRSQPVRVGNDARSHLQLDFYADIVAGIHTEQVRDPKNPVLELWDVLVEMTDWLCEAWKLPDRGPWEIRSEPRHLIASKMSCWYALDRMVKLAHAQRPLDLNAPIWHAAANELKQWLEANALAPDGGLRADTDEAELCDGYLLQAAWRAPWPPGHPIVRRTVDRVLRHLSSGPFVYRYSTQSADGLPPGEGAFLPCSFWAVEALARVGRWEEAHERMEALVSFSRPLGLLPEEADPITGDFLGNLPQALSHLTLVQAALSLAEGPS